MTPNHPGIWIWLPHKAPEQPQVSRYIPVVLETDEQGWRKLMPRPSDWDMLDTPSWEYFQDHGRWNPECFYRFPEKTTLPDRPGIWFLRHEHGKGSGDHLAIVWGKVGKEWNLMIRDEDGMTTLLSEATESYCWIERVDDLPSNLAHLALPED